MEHRMRFGKLGRRVAVGATGLAAIAAAASSIGARAASAGGAVHATAVMRDVSGNEIGWVRFIEDATGRVHVNVKVDGLSPGLHGIHVHAAGACTPSFNDAGGHHNPGGGVHGDHNGDLPNLEVNGAGRGRLNTITHRATLTAGPTTILDSNGSSVIIHALVDDGVTNPTGNSGARVACGVIAPE